MEFHSTRILGFLPFFLIFLFQADGRTGNLHRQDSDYNQKLQSGSSIKVIQTSSGDIFDCVDIYKQPAFDHPLLKNHKLQMRPSSYPEDLENDLPESVHENSGLENLTCPDGSVPIFRSSIEADPKLVWKDLPFLADETTMEEEGTDGNRATGFSWSLERTYIHDYYGTTAAINVYALPQVKHDQRTAASIWITNRDDPRQTKFAFINVGWQVYPELYGDRKTRFFAAWTADNRQKTGCYDLQCPGFVATSKYLTLGAVISPLSTLDGQQYVIQPFLFKDNSSGNWWLALKDRKNLVGYWPKEIFENFHVTRQVVYGGVAYSDAKEPGPPMGNGHFVGEPTHKACYIADIKIIDYANVLMYLVSGDRYEDVTSSECYNIGPYDGARYSFYFGGDGICARKMPSLT